MGNGRLGNGRLGEWETGEWETGEWDTCFLVSLASSCEREGEEEDCSVTRRWMTPPECSLGSQAALTVKPFSSAAQEVKVLWACGPHFSTSSGELVDTTVGGGVENRRGQQEKIRLGGGGGNTCKGYNLKLW